MNTIIAFQKCKDHVTGTCELLNYYRKYHRCVAVNSIEDEMDEVLKDMSSSYVVLMAAAGKDATVAESEGPDENSNLFVNSINNRLENSCGPIVNMLSKVSTSRREAFLNNFANAHRAASKLICRMKLLIQKSQHFNQSAIRISA